MRTQVSHGPSFIAGIARRGMPAMPARLLPDKDGHGTGVLDQPDVRERLVTQIDEHTRAILATVEAAEARGSGAPFTDEENEIRSAAEAAREPLEARLAVLDAEAERRRKAALRGNGGGDTSGTIVRSPKTYDDPKHSYFLDLARAKLQLGDGDGGVVGANERLDAHARELDVELPAREARRQAVADGQIDNLAREQRWSSEQRRTVFEKRAGTRGMETRVNPNRTDGQGGYFVPPLWQMDQYIDLPRFGRTAANLCAHFDLPGGTDSINVPKIATGTTVAVQTADAGAVSSTDLTDTFVNAPVRTLAGQQDIAMQLLDQSPVAFDEIVFNDLIADYNQKLDVQVVNGSGSSGQLLGILGAGGTTVTYTDASPTLPELWVPLLQSASKVAYLRKMAANGVLMDPRVWYWALSQLDTATRPLLLGDGSSAQNTMGTGGDLEVDGPAGRLTYGLSAYLDGNIPSNLGAGTNESRVITARWSDLYLWEGAMRTRVLDQILSGTMQFRLQMYNYVAFMPNRRPEAIAVIGGTGLIPATGF